MQDIVILYYFHDHSMTSIYDKLEMKDVVIGIVIIHTNMLIIFKRSIKKY